MNAFVFSSPAHALKFTACPRALVTMSLHGGTSANAENDNAISMSAQNRNAVRLRVMSLRAAGSALGFARYPFCAPLSACLFEHRTQHLLVKTIAADA